MKSYFLSKSNVDDQYKQLERRVEFDKSNPKSRKSLRKLLVRHMERVYEQYGKKKPAETSIVDFVDKLNSIAISASYNAFKDYRRRKKYGNNF